MEGIILDFMLVGLEWDNTKNVLMKRMFYLNWAVWRTRQLL